jgi:hypothetical protein
MEVHIKVNCLKEKDMEKGIIIVQKINQNIMGSLIMGLSMAMAHYNSTNKPHTKDISSKVIVMVKVK